MKDTRQRIIVAMMDGLDMAYLDSTPMPAFNKMMNEGVFKEVSGVFPSVTNVNNVSIACGAWPEEHGISANSFYNKATGEPEYMNSAQLIRCPTLFARATTHGIKSALLTAKRKTLELFDREVEIGIAAEAPTKSQVAAYGQPADIYSREINYWLWQAAIDILENRPDIGLIYVHITDYPMHTWGPEQNESHEHLTRLDGLIGEAVRTAPDAAFYATADHGMNYKKRCWDLARVLRREGVPARFVLSPERDYYIVHHRNFTGCSWVWLTSPDDAAPTRRILTSLTGVEAVLTGEEAASRFHLDPDHIGDLIVLGDKDTMFGDMAVDYEDLPATYRAHGSLHEMRLPLLIWNSREQLPAGDAFTFNLDLTRFLFRRK